MNMFETKPTDKLQFQMFSLAILASGFVSTTHATKLSLCWGVLAFEQHTPSSITETVCGHSKQCHSKYTNQPTHTPRVARTTQMYAQKHA